jgi:hypothetical protein
MVLQNDDKTLINSCHSFWGMNSIHQVFSTCDDTSEKVWIIICAVDELTIEPHIGTALFHSQYSGFNVRGDRIFRVSSLLRQLQPKSISPQSYLPFNK